MRVWFLSVCASWFLIGPITAGATPPAQTTVPAVQPQSPPPPAGADSRPPAVQCVGAEGVVYFDLGATALNADSENALHGIATARRPECASQFAIIGYTDSTGSVRRNLQLARQRATAVQQRLVALGVPQEEIVIGGAGESEPQSATEDRLNRRVTVTLTARPRAPVAQPSAPTPPAASPR